MTSDLPELSCRPLLPQLAAWASELRVTDVPERVRALATSQIIAQIAAMRAGLRHSKSAVLLRAYGPLRQSDPRRASVVLGALGSWLNLDDTAYAGHLAPSTVAVPVAWALAGHSDGRTLLTAVVAANECAARITAAATLGPLRGQSALHTHLAGAVAGRLASEGAPARRWVDAMSLAFAAPPWPTMHAFLGGDAKLIHVVAPVRAAMDACDAATAGLTGPPDVLEHPRGFLARFAAVPLPELVTEDLGHRWHTDTLSFKLRPGGPGIDAAVDCAIELHQVVRGARVTGVEIAASAYTLFAGRQSESYQAGPDTPLSALLLCTGYPVATALLTGDLRVEDFDQPELRDQDRWTLARSVQLVHDPEMTRQLFASVAPFGAALRRAGERARPWLSQFVGEELAELALVTAAEKAGADDSFREATKATPARVTVRLADGRSITRARTVPLGAAGPDTRRRHGELARRKFLAQGGSEAVADALSGDLTSCSASELSRLLQAALSDK